MKQLLVVFFLFLGSMLINFGYGQHAFLNEIEHSFANENPIIVGTPDNGWVIYLPNETIVLKYDQCGQQEWVKDYSISNINCCVGSHIEALPNGNMGFLTRVEVGTVHGYRLSVIDKDGEPVWSNLYSKSGNDYFAYSLNVTTDGNFLIYGIETPVGGGVGFLNLIKIAPDGQTIWSKRIQDGFVWGATVATSDNGCLLRSGDTFMKIDVNGDLEWATSIKASFTYNYLAAVEVSDGYIFTKTRNGSTEVGFFKMDKQGNNVWTQARFTNFGGQPLALTKLPNGNFTAVFNDGPQGGVSGFVIIEFDKDLNIIKESKTLHSVLGLSITDFSIAQNGIPLVVGNEIVTNLRLFFGKLDSNYLVGCNEPVLLTWTNEPVISNTVTVNIFNGNIEMATNSFRYISNSYTDKRLCNNTINVPLLNLGSDLTKCNNEALVLKDVNASIYGIYQWSTGETTAEITVTKPGKYWLEGSFLCVNNTATDTIIVTDIVVQDPNLITDSILCGSQSILLNAEIKNGTYVWQDNSTDAIFSVTKPGNYYVDITFEKCQERFSSNILSCEDFLIPNIFTPNNDGINDYFGIVYDGNEEVVIEVFNRWGVLVFQSNKKGFSWDGTVNGEPVAAGVYFYTIQIGNENRQGSVTLVR